MTTHFHRQFFVLTITCILTVLAANGQDFATYLKDNAVKINRTDSLDNSVYKLLTSYQLIMVGEMHGTNEPAKFVTNLAKLFTDNGDSVQVGLEIPSEQMTKFLSEHTDSSIYASDFFSRTATDGRESLAWTELISTLDKNKKVKLFFFDAASPNRDRKMYLNVKNQILKNPRHKTITLSGNVHNMIQPFKGENTMGCYLKTDKELNLQDKICSLNHNYKSGTMINNSGKGLQLRQVSSPTSAFSTSVDYDSYLFLFSKATVDSYSGIYFTRLVTAAEMVNKD